MSISADFKDFSKYDHAIQRIHDLAAEPGKKDKLFYVGNWHLLAGSNYDEIAKLDQVQLYKYFNARKQELLTDPVQKCLASKLVPYETIRKQFAEPWHAYLSFNELFVLWMEDLVALYRLHDPDDTSLEKCER